MGVNLDVAGVDHQPFVVGIFDEDFKQGFPQPFIAPAAKATVGVLPIAVIGRQVTPGRTGAQNPEYRVDELPVIPCNSTPDSLAARQVGLQKTPGMIGNIVASVGGFHGIPFIVFY